MIAFAGAVLLLVAGGLVTGFGLLVWLSIPRSDTATWSLVLFGLPFVVAGLLVAAAGLLLARRAGRR